MKIRIKLLFMSCVLGTSLLTTSTSVFAKNNVNRLAGQDRYGTSNAIVSQGWTQSSCAILVNSQNFPDAITASPLAKKFNAPILLTDTSSLTNSTKEKLQGLGVKNVFIIGGVGVVSPQVENTLKSMDISVKRICGQDRYETSVNVAKELGSSKGIFIVNGEHYEDALSAAPIAAKLQYPIMLVDQNYVSDMVKNYINNQVKTNNTEINVIGGQDVLSNNVISSLNPTKTYNQSTKYDRNLALINNYKGQLDLSTAYLASDKGFADALSGSVLAGKNGNPIILVGDSNQSSVNSYINNNNVSNVTILGGTGVLSNDVVAGITGNSNVNSNNSDNNTAASADKVHQELQVYDNLLNDTDWQKNNGIIFSGDGKSTIDNHWIIDIDQDGVYEMLVHHGSCEANLTMSVITYNNGNIKIEHLPSDHNYGADYSKSEKVLFTHGGRGGSNYITGYKLENGHCEKVFTAFNNEARYGDSEQAKATYEINEQNVSKKDYEEAFKRFGSIDHLE